MFLVGSKVRSLSALFSDIIGTIESFYYEDKKRTIRIAVVRVDSSCKFIIGSTIRFYERHLELIRSIIDPTSPYQYCNKCDTLTSNKPSLCCDHKHLNNINILFSKNEITF